MARNEYFRTVKAADHVCPNCGAGIKKGESIWSWGRYWLAQWRTQAHFCKACFAKVIQPRLGPGDLIGYGRGRLAGSVLPKWLRKTKAAVKVAA